MPSVQRMVTAHTPEAWNVAPQWGTREADDESIYGPAVPRVRFERIEPEDVTLIGGIPTEEVLASIERGWTWPEVEPSIQAYRARKHAPWLMESDPLPNE